MEEIKEWIINWLSENSIEQDINIQNILDGNYLEYGVLDSFGFLRLISELEQQFNFKFSIDDFSDNSMLTINGLTKLIYTIIQGGVSNDNI